jgi:hypothetical protein
VILANRSGVNAGERFSLGISEESIWLGPHSEILGASEYKPIVLAIPGVRPRLAKYVARIGLFVTPVTSHREWLRYSSVSWFERLSPSPPTPPPLETTKLKTSKRSTARVSFAFGSAKNARAAIQPALGWAGARRLSIRILKCCRRGRGFKTRGREGWARAFSPRRCL